MLYTLNLHNLYVNYISIKLGKNQSFSWHCSQVCGKVSSIKKQLQYNIQMVQGIQVSIEAWSRMCELRQWSLLSNLVGIYLLVNLS